MGPSRLPADIANLPRGRQPKPWRSGLSSEGQEAMGVEDFLPERPAAHSRRRILPPLLDLICLVELRQLEGLIRCDPAFGQGKADDEGATAAGGGGEAGKHEGR